MKRSGQQTLLNFVKRPKGNPKAVPEASNISEADSPLTPAATPANCSNDETVTNPEQKKPVNEPSSYSEKSLNTSWKVEWIASLSAAQRDLLTDEIENIGDSWLRKLAPELTKPYFLELKKFLKSQTSANKQVFPPVKDIYSWSQLCRLEDVKVVILGQDPYHNINQAHGLAFSVNPPTKLPPSLRNIYKELESCYPESFRKPSSGLLTPWARQGVLLLNACLTVEAHKANSHANKGWETFTERVLELVATNPKVVFMAWGTPAFKRVSKIRPDSRHLILKSVHPSPLSASRGWFGSQHFVKANNWLKEHTLEEIDWQV